MLLTITRVVTSIIPSRINVVMTTYTPQSFVNLLILKNARREINVGERITGSRDFITKTSTRLNFATATQTKLESANMENIALLHIRLRI